MSKIKELARFRKSLDSDSDELTKQIEALGPPLTAEEEQVALSGYERESVEDITLAEYLAIEAEAKYETANAIRNLRKELLSLCGFAPDMDIDPYINAVYEVHVEAENRASYECDMREAEEAAALRAERAAKRAAKKAAEAAKLQSEPAAAAEATEQHKAA
jgi:hypothetical protein